MNKPAILKALRQHVQYWSWPEYREASDAVDAREEELQNDKLLKSLRKKRDQIGFLCNKQKNALDKERKILYSKFITANPPSATLLARIQKFLTRQPDERE